MFAGLKSNLLILLISAVVIGFLQTRLHAVTAERNAARDEIGVLSTQIRDQNNAITQWQQQALEQKQRLTQAEQKVKQQAIVLQQNVQQILNQKVSPECRAAMQWGASQAQKLASQW